jgi:hypothetical protein
MLPVMRTSRLIYKHAMTTLKSLTKSYKSMLRSQALAELNRRNDMVENLLRSCWIKMASKSGHGVFTL